MDVFTIRKIERNFYCRSNLKKKGHKRKRDLQTTNRKTQILWLGLAKKQYSKHENYAYDRISNLVNDFGPAVPRSFMRLA